MRAAGRFALLTIAVKPARPFDEELNLDLLTILANAACLTRAGELRHSFLITGQLWSGIHSSSTEEGDGDGLAFRFPFPVEGRRRMRLARREQKQRFCRKGGGREFDANS